MFGFVRFASVGVASSLLTSGVLGVPFSVSVVLDLARDEENRRDG